MVIIIVLILSEIVIEVLMLCVLFLVCGFLMLIGDVVSVLNVVVVSVVFVLKKILK